MEAISGFKWMIFLRPGRPIAAIPNWINTSGQASRTAFVSGSQLSSFIGVPWMWAMAAPAS